MRARWTILLAVAAALAAVTAAIGTAGAADKAGADSAAAARAPARAPVPVPVPVPPEPRPLPRPPSGRIRPIPHSVDIDVAVVRAGDAFAPFRQALAAGAFGAARSALATVAARGKPGPELEVAQYDLIELDFFEAQFDTAQTAYRAFAMGHPRGYLTNDAIARIFLIDENSDAGRKPLELFAAAERERRCARPDSAAALLSGILDHYAGSLLEDDVRLAMGDLCLESGRPAAALAHYSAVADSMSGSALAAAALLRIGRYRLEVESDAKAAAAAYERVLDTDPQSLEADEARRGLESLRGKT